MAVNAHSNMGIIFDVVVYDSYVGENAIESQGGLLDDRERYFTDEKLEVNSVDSIDNVISDHVVVSVIMVHYGEEIVHETTLVIVGEIGVLSIELDPRGNSVDVLVNTIMLVSQKSSSLHCSENYLLYGYNSIKRIIVW